MAAVTADQLKDALECLPGVDSVELMQELDCSEEELEHAFIALHERDRLRRVGALQSPPAAPPPGPRLP